MWFTDYVIRTFVSDQHQFHYNYKPPCDTLDTCSSHSPWVRCNSRPSLSSPSPLPAVPHTTHSGSSVRYSSPPQLHLHLEARRQTKKCPSLYKKQLSTCTPMYHSPLRQIMVKLGGPILCPRYFTQPT